MSGPQGTARTVLLVTAGNLLPLLLVAAGQLDLPLLLVCYGVEAVLLPGDPGRGAWHDWQLRAVALLVSAILLVRAIGLVDWTIGALAVLASTVVLTLGGTWLAARDPGAASPPGGLSAVLWRLCLLLVGGVVALSYAEDLTVLRAAGWEPEPVGHLVSTPFALAFNELVFALGLAPMAAAALVLVVFKTVNEALWAALRLSSPATARDRAGRGRTSTVSG